LKQSKNIVKAAADPSLKLALKINAVADLVQRILNNSKFIRVEFQSAGWSGCFGGNDVRKRETPVYSGRGTPNT
jgi:hypothetical protein